MSLRSILIIAIAASGLFAGSPSAQRLAPNALLTIDANRATVIGRIVDEWGDRLTASGAGISIAQLREILSGLRADHLLAASLAGSVIGLRDVVSRAVVRADASVSPRRVQIMSLGDVADDLVYTPVTPCRIVDTRSGAGGMFLTGNQRNWVAYSPDGFASQGGSATNCGIPVRPVAIMANTTLANTIGGPEFFTLWPFGQARPLASTVNWWGSGQQPANAEIVPLCTGSCTSDFSAYASGQTHAIIDVLGYFNRPTNYGGVHIITGLYATDSGGVDNTASGDYGAIGGGKGNIVSATYGTVAGGSGNTASGTQQGFATVAGGANNTATGDFSTVGGGSSNQTADIASTVAGGQQNQAIHIYSTVGGGGFNRAISYASTIAGGTSNFVSGAYSTVAGGVLNLVTADNSAIAGGQNNIALATWTSVGGGSDNAARGSYGTVPGGGNNAANGYASIAAGGRNNTASGQYSLAAGRRASTQTSGISPTFHDGALVWADSNDFDFNSTANNEFSARATGGVRFVTAIDGSGEPSWVCGVSGGPGGSWGCSSDRNLKTDLIAIDGVATLEQLVALPVYRWLAKGDARKIPHAGPMAQDFMAAFGLGDNDRMIGFSDAQGVAFAAIQGLRQLLQEKNREIATLQSRLQAIEAKLGL